MMYRYGSETRSVTVHVSASVTASIATKPVRPPEHPDHTHFPAAGMTAFSVSMEGAGITVRKVVRTDPEPEYPGQQFIDADVTLQVGVEVSVGFGSETETTTIWVGSQFIPKGSVGSASGTWNGTFSVSVPVINCIDIAGRPVSILDAPFPSAVTLLQKYDTTAMGTASCAGKTVTSHPVEGNADYRILAYMAVNAGDGGGGTWSVSPVGGDFYAMPDSLSASDQYGSLDASAGNVTLSSASDGGAFGVVQTAWYVKKGFGLSGVVRAMEAAYPDPLMGICSKFAGDTDADMPISGGSFSASYDQRRASFDATYTSFDLIYGETGSDYGKFKSTFINEWQPVSCAISAASLEALGEDLSPPAPPPDPDTGAVDPFAEQGPPRATRLQFRGRRFNALSLSLPLDFLIDDCSALNVSSGTFQGVWETVGSGDAPTSAGGGIHFTGSVRRSFTHDVSLSSYRYLRLHIAPPTDGDAPAPVLQITIGGKTFPVRRVGTSDYWFVDLCAETGGPQISAAGSKWPLKQRYFPVVSDGMPKYEKSYLGIGRCKSFMLSASNSEAEVTILRVELSRRGFYDKEGVTAAPPTVTFCPPFYRGKLIYEAGPDAPPTDLDRHWPTREFETRYFGDGYEQPPDDGALREDLSGSVDEDDGYEDSREGEDGVPETPSKTIYWARQHVLAYVSGRQGLQEKDSSCQITETPTIKSISWAETPIWGLVASVNQTNVNGVWANPGWMATDNKPAPTSGCDVALPDFESCYLNSDRPTTWIFGGGAMALGTDIEGGGGWQFGFDRALGSYDAQQMFDSIEWFPGCGDFFNFGGGDGKAIILRAATILRGSAQGLTISTQRKAASGKTVELRQGEPSPGAIVSSGLSGADGLYVMHDAPFTKTVQPALGKIGSLLGAFKAYGRKRQRLVFVVVVTPDGRWISADIGPTGRHVRAFGGDALMAGASNVFAANVWNDGEIGPGARPCVRYDASGELALLFEQEGSIALLRSDSQGRTWLAPMTVSNSGFFPALAIGATGLLYCFWRTEAGGIAGKVLDVRGNVVYPSTGALSVVSGGVAEDAIAASCDPLTRRVFVHYRNDAGEIIIAISADNGRTYS